MRSPHFTHTKMLIAVFMLQMAVMLLSFGEACAAYDVTISTAPSANVTIDEGSPYTWTSSGPAANISVYELQAKLNNGYDVEIVTGAAGNEAGNINVNAAFSWNDATILTLYAEQDININAVISASGPQSALTMTGNVKVGFKPGEANGFAGRVDFPGRIGAGFLKINNADYTVINSLGAQGSNTGTDLQGMRGNLAGYYALGADIDASTTSTWNGGAGFEPIGNITNSFSSVFDGLGHTISGLTINRPSSDYVGLFGYSLNATLRNVGLVGGNVTGNDYAGGLVGYAEVSSVFGSINNCYNSGNVSSYTTGGLAGYADGVVNTTYTSGTVNGNSAVGGLVGDNDAVITSSYVKGTVVGTDFVGGLAGINLNGSISNSYATGSVVRTGTEFYVGVGGLVGYNSGSISTSYAAGNVTGAVPTGGLVGFNGNAGTVTASFWDTETSGQATSDGGTGSTTADMKQFATFSSAGWDISSSDSIWSIVDGQSYPFLRRFAPLPVVATASATAVAATSATLNGSVNANGADASVSFEYGPSTSYGTTVSAVPVTVSGSGNTLVSASISGLTPGLSYHYRVVATNSVGMSYSADAAFTALKMNQVISGFSPPGAATFGDGPITLSASAPAGAVVFSVTEGPGNITGNQLSINGAGTIKVQASQPGNSSYNAAPNITASIVVAKATVSITLSNLNQTYNGSPRAVTASAPGYQVSITYAGSAVAPTNAGSYAVVATIINSSNYGGEATGTLTIAKASATVTLGGLSQTYNGSAKVATATTNPADKTVTYTYDGSGTAPTNAGSYAVVGTINDANYQGSASGTLIIGKAPATVTLGSLSQTYDGNPKVATATTTPSGLTVDFTYNGSATAPTAAGTYTVVGTVNNANYSGTNTGTLTIAKASATVTLGSLNQTYDGSAKSVTATTSPAGKAVTFTYGGVAAVPVNAGSYAVVGTISDGNYQGSVSGTLTIAKAAATVMLSNLSQYYDGGAKAVTVATTPSGLAFSVTYGGSAVAPADAGSYAVVAAVSDANYVGVANGVLVIAVPKLTVAVSVNNGTQTTGVGGTVTSSPAGISCANSVRNTVVACTNDIAGTLSLYATSSALSTFAGWGGACSGLGICSVAMDSDKAVTATFNQATLLHIDGTTYPTLQAAYNVATSGSFIQLLDNSVAGTLDAGRNVTVTLKGGYDTGYATTPGMTTLTAPLTIRSGTVVVDRIVIK